LRHKLEQPVAYVLGVAIVAVTTLVAWIYYLRFCRFLVKHTNDPASLRHAATAAKAYRSGGLSQLARAIGKLARLPRGKG
jgi:hypothetical protein